MKDPAFTTIEQQFISSAEPLAPLAAAIFDLLKRYMSKDEFERACEELKGVQDASVPVCRMPKDEFDRACKEFTRRCKGEE